MLRYGWEILRAYLGSELHVCGKLDLVGMVGEVSSLLSRETVGLMAPCRKHPLTCPFPVGVRVFPLEGMG